MLTCKQSGEEITSPFFFSSLGNEVGLVVHSVPMTYCPYGQQLAPKRDGYDQGVGSGTRRPRPFLEERAQALINKKKCILQLQK